MIFMGILGPKLVQCPHRGLIAFLVHSSITISENRFKRKTKVAKCFSFSNFQVKVESFYYLNYHMVVRRGSGKLVIC